MKLTDKEKELQQAWYDYRITNRLIAYSEVPELTEEQIEARCKEQYEKDCDEVRRKYGSTKKTGLSCFK